MAATAPYEGAVFVPGTMEEVGTALLDHVDDPQLVVAYAGYGFWAPAAAVGKVKGADEQELTNAPIAPYTAPYVDDSAYESREVDVYGQPIAPDPGADEVDLEANAPFPAPADEPVVEQTTGAEDEPDTKSKRATKKTSE